MLAELLADSDALSEAELLADSEALGLTEALVEAEGEREGEADGLSNPVGTSVENAGAGSAGAPVKSLSFEV